MHSPFYSSYLQYTGFTDAFQDDSCIFIVLCVTTNIQERFQTFLLEGVLGDELVDLNMGLLADAVGPVGGLILGCLIPPGVKVDDDVRGHQVQPGAAGLQGDEEQPVSCPCPPAPAWATKPAG